MSTHQLDILNKVLQLLEGEEKVVLGSQKDLFLILGVTGSGDESIQYGIVSKTIFPELIVEDNDVFCDCLGFEDTRGVDKNILSTYFIKKVLDHAEKLKIILTVDGTSFFDRITFTRLLKHISSLIRNVGKFLNGMILVLTKVDTRSQTDKSFKRDVANFLIEVKKNASTELEGPDISFDEKKLYEDTKILIDTLLIQNNENYIKLGLFKKPKQEGNLFGINTFKKDRKDLLFTLKENVSFIIKNETDFDFTISEESKNKITDLNKIMNECIEKHVLRLGNDLEHYFENYIRWSNNIYKLKDELERIDIIGFKENLRLLKTPKKFVQAIIKNKIVKYGSYIDFLRPIQNNESKELKIHVDKDNFTKFLEKVKPPFLPSKYEYITQIQVNDLRINELNQLLKITLTPYFEIKNEDKNLIIKGDYIVLSKIDDKYFTNIKSIKVFCLNTLFIDTNLYGKKFQGVTITCISLCWNIIDKRLIELNRAMGLPHSPSKAENRRNGRTNVQLLHGKDGRPGLPGETAGCFFGIGREFINRNELIINADGGKGGPGQHGSDGGRGQDEENFKVYKFSNRRIQKKILDAFYYSSPYPDFDYKFISESNNTRDKYPGEMPGDIPNVNPTKYKEIIFNVFGKSEIQGGNGGNGGKGGKGSYSKIIKIINTSNIKESTDRTSNKHKKGENGIGGKGGEGEKIEWNKEEDIINNEKAESGKDGEKDINEKDIQLPKECLKQYNFAIDINNYKKYLRLELGNRIKQEFLASFYLELDNHPVVRGVYDTLRFFDEFQELENQFYYLTDELTVDTLPFYESFLTRINEYVIPNIKGQYQNSSAQNELTSTEQKSYKKALNYLYTTILSKIWSLKITSSYLVIDIYKYFKLVTKNINLLKEKEEQVVLDQYKNDYKKNIDGKIEEAKTFIKECIILEIENVSNELDKKIEDLVTETIKLQKKVDNKSQKLAKQQEKLNKSLVLRKIFGVLKIGSQVASFIGPIGTAAGAVIGGVVMVAETIILDDTIHEEISKELENHPEKLSDLNNRIKGIRSNLEIETNRGEESDQETINKIQKELKETLGKKEKSLKKEGSDVDQNTKDALKVVNHFNNALRISELSVDSYNKYKMDEHKLEIIGKTLQENNIEFQRLKDYENTIYQNIIPIT
ncbi:3788_t:CDS:2, partial [Dentiscutata erythropus]